MSDAGHDLHVVGNGEYPRDLRSDFHGGVAGLNRILTPCQVGDPVLHTHDQQNFLYQCVIPLT
jgi:hypothetical protein